MPESGSAQRSPEERWENFVGIFIDNKLVVLVVAVVLLIAGLAYAPFRWDLGSLPRDPVPVDALPDISENQQIVFTKWPGRSPRDVEDQITYPLTTSLLGIPGVRSVRSTSVFGFSSIYVIFEDDVEFYWSRSRVLEKLASLPAGTLPADVGPALGPDATALGQVYWYTLEAQDDNGNVVPGAFSLDELRSIQDWTVRYALQAVDGVSEVASVGGYVREYQVDIDPEAMLAAKITIGQVAKAVRSANLDVGARTIDINRAEYVVRGIGFIKTTGDLEEVVIATRDHTPIRIKDVGKVGFGPALRRGLLDKAGAEAVGGVAVVRFGDNPLAVIDRVRDKIEELAPGLPRRTLADGTVAQIRIVPFYDRTQLIHETLDTLTEALLQEILITIVVILLIMRQLRSSLLVTLVVPLAVLGTFVLMRATGVDANIMALGGIAIAIGTIVDMGIVFTESIVVELDEAPPGTDRRTSVRRGAGMVAGAVLTSILADLLGFIPIFGLTGAESKLFTPLAYTKVFALVSAFVIGVLLIPTLAHLILYARREDSAERDWRALLGGEAAFDWMIFLGGLALAAAGAGLASAIVVAVALLRLSDPLLGPRARPVASACANIIVLVAVVVALTHYWMPLGVAHSFTGNLGFVVIAITAVVGGFSLFGRSYPRLLEWCLRNKAAFLIGNVALVLFGVTVWLGVPKMLGLEKNAEPEGSLVQDMARAMPGIKEDFMPPFDEGSFLFMPTTTPHASIGQAADLLQSIDSRIAAVPEVSGVVGKVGRAESPLDPAPISMIESLITYHPEFALDHRGEVARFRYDEVAQEFVRDEAGELVRDEGGRPYRQWREHIKSPDDIWNEIARAGEHPGLTGAPRLMPINARIAMLQTGMRSAVGLKVKGPDLATVEAFGLELEGLLKQVPELAPSTVYADRIVGKPYLEIVIDRESISRHGLTIVDVQNVIQVAIGGRTLTTTVEGRERYPVRVRYMREERDTIEGIRRISVAAPAAQQIPLEQLAEIRYVRGPQMIRGEDTFLNAYVTWAPAPDTGEVESVEAVEAMLDEKIASGALEVPPGVSYRFAGTFENQVRAKDRLLVLVPITLAVIFLALYIQLGSAATALMVFWGMALSISGAFILLWLYGKPWFLDVSPFGVDLRTLLSVGETRLTVAVWVGFLALFGVATDNGVIVASYLTQSFRGHTAKTVAECRARVVKAGTRRVRPCMMTIAATLLALLPVLTSPGRGADLMVPMALPTVGGVGLTLLTLLTVPVLYCLARELEIGRRDGAA
jgi:Cu(I)/Ag(I) efflux system membrane protein CusA/SilA